MENKMMGILEDVKLLLKAIVDGQEASEERFERRLSRLEEELAETKADLLATVKSSDADLKRDISNVRTELKKEISELKFLEETMKHIKEKIDFWRP